MPAANSPPCLGWLTDGSIDSLSKWPHLRVFGRSFWNPRVSFWNQFRNHVCGPGGLSRGPQAGRFENKFQNVVCGSFVCPSWVFPRDYFGAQSVNK